MTMRAVQDIANFTEPIWEQQKDCTETSEQYAMFLRYAELRPSERSVARAWRLWVKNTDRAKLPTPLIYENLAEVFHWQERATTRDIFELKNRYRIWAEREWSVREADFAIGERLRQKALIHLDKIDDDKYTMAMDEIASLLQMASTMQRGSIPQVNNLTSNQIREMLNLLPEDKRNSVLRIVAQEYQKPLLQVAESSELVDNTIEGEVIEVTEAQAEPSVEEPAKEPFHTSRAAKRLADKHFVKPVDKIVELKPKVYSSDG